MLTCAECGKVRRGEGESVQSAREAMRVTPFRLWLSLSLVYDRFQNVSSPDCALLKVPDMRRWDARRLNECSWAQENG